MNPTLTAETYHAHPTSRTSTPAPYCNIHTHGKPWHVLGMEDLADRLHDIINTARDLKSQANTGPLPRLLDGVAVAVIFEKNSTRTRVSFDIGIQRLGGIVTMLDAHSSQLGRGESIEDTAGVLSRYAQAIVYRAKGHDAARDLAKYASVPVVNALTDIEHPCQVLADLMTLAEHFDSTDDPGMAGKTLAYIGDGNNMCHSYLLGAPLAGLNIRIATPAEYAPDPVVVAKAKQLAARAGTEVVVTTDPKLAVHGADAVATDTWISMGDEADSEARLSAFKGFTVNKKLMALAKPGAVFLHCLPGHWGHEATHAVAHGPQSLIFDEAENRMWAQMALLAHILGRAP